MPKDGKKLRGGALLVDSDTVPEGTGATLPEAQEIVDYLRGIGKTPGGAAAALALAWCVVLIETAGMDEAEEQKRVAAIAEIVQATMPIVKKLRAEALH